MSDKADEVIKKRRHEYIRDTFIIFAVFAIVVTGIFFMIKFIVKQPSSIVLYSETGEILGTYSDTENVHIPTKNGYESAWVSDDGTVYGTIEAALSSGEKSVKQVFTPIEYTVTLYLTGGSAIKDFGFEYHEAKEGEEELGAYFTKTYTVEDEDFDLPLAKTNIVAEKHGCKFEFWSSVNYLGKNFSVDSLKATEAKTIYTSAAQDIVLYAAWREMPSTISVVGFDGGVLFFENHTVLTILDEEELTASVLPFTPTDYVFMGFYTDSALKHPFDFTKELGQEHVTIYTKWHTPEFTLTFKDLDDTTLSETVYMAKDDIIIYDYTPHLPNGKDFDCWLLDNQPFTLTKMPADDVVLYPRLINIPYTITWIIEGVETSETYYWGDTLNAPTASKPSDNTYYYAFDKWSPTLATVSEDATYTASFTQEYINYSVTFMNGDDIHASKTDYHYGDTLVAPDDPTKAADNTYTYTFNGWDTELPSTVTGDAVFTAQYNSVYIDYTVTFYGEDGSTVLSFKDDYHYGETIVKPADPTKDSDETYDYLFSGWGAEVTTVTGTTDYTAQFTPVYIEYMVTFVDYDDSEISSASYHYNDDVVIPDNPTRAADNEFIYTFASWNPTVSDKVTEDATYKAAYDSSTRYYTVTFKDYNGTVLSTKADYEYNNDTVIPDDPTRDADVEKTYTFDKWSPAVSDKVTEDKIYTATYSESYIDYTITFVDYDDSEISSETYHYGDTVEVPEDPERAADNTYTYEFDDWDSEVTAVTGTKTYKATYTQTYINYTVTFKNEDGTVLLTKTDYHYGDAVAEPTETPTKPSDVQYDYTFDAWDHEVVNVAGNTIYTATYTATEIDYTVTFKDYDGTVLLTKTNYHYGQTVTTPDDPERAADETYTYEFAGWSPAVVDVAGSAIYTATYTGTYINYTITFKDADGTVLLTKTNYHYGDEVTPPEDPTKAEDDTYTYAFAGWSPAVVDVAEDAIYTAAYTPTYKNYTITFINWDDAEISRDTYHFGAEVTPPADPTRAADNTYTYAFAGWTPAVANVAGEATYKATYTPTYINYTITFVNYNDDVLSTKTDCHYNDVVTAPAENPTKPSTAYNTYSFNGWDSEITNVTGNKTYKATFEEHVRQYTYYFYVGDDCVKSDTIDYDTVIVAPSDPTKEPTVQYTYTFNGWYEDLEDSETKFTTGKHISTSDIRFYAKFDSTTNTYTYVFHNGSAEFATTVDYGTEINLASIGTPTKTGYTFEGWYDSNNTKLTANPTIVGDIDYYAHFTANTYTLTYKFVKTGAAIPTSNPEPITETTVTYDQAYGDLGTPVITGYTFVGWYFDDTYAAESKIESTDIVDITEDKTIYAKWELTPYHVHAFVNGVEVATFEFDIEHNVDLTAYTNNDEFDFGGWYEDTIIDLVNTSTPIALYGQTTGDINVYGVVKTKGLTITGNSVSGYSGSATSIIIPKIWDGEYITTIETAVFMDKTSLTSVDAPYITEIQARAFSGCTNVNIDLSNVEIIGDNAFSECEGLTDVNLSSATSIGNKAFAYTYITEISLPVDGLTLGDKVFYRCNIATIHYAGTQQQFEALVNGTNDNENLLEATLVNP